MPSPTSDDPKWAHHVKGIEKTCTMCGKRIGHLYRHMHTDSKGVHQLADVHWICGCFVENVRWRAGFQGQYMFVEAGKLIRNVLRKRREGWGTRRIAKALDVSERKVVMYIIETFPTLPEEAYRRYKLTQKRKDKNNDA